MVSATGHTHLQLRGNVFYFRIAIPLALRSILGKDDFVLSLRTSERRRAVRSCRWMSNGAEYFFEMMEERLPTDTDLKSMQRIYFERYMRGILTEHENIKRIVDTGVKGPISEDPYGFINLAEHEMQRLKPLSQINSYEIEDYRNAVEMLRKRNFDESQGQNLASRLVHGRMEAHRIKLAYQLCKGLQG